MLPNYKIELDGMKIGTVQLSPIDLSMGVIGGIMNCLCNNPYEFFKHYCQQKQIVISLDDPEYQVIATQIIPQLVVLNQQNQPITHSGIYIEGMAAEGYQIIILGVDSHVLEHQFHFQAA